jgi:hypothetical protein
MLAASLRLPEHCSAIQKKQSDRVVEDDAKGKALAALEAAHPMAHVDAIGAARALLGPLPHGEDDAVALAQAHNLHPRLHPGPLLGQHEFAAVKVASRLGKEDRDLERKKVLAIDVLVQAIVVAGAIAQQERRRPRLTRLMAAREERFVLGGVSYLDVHHRVPAVGDRREPPIKAATQRDDEIGQGVGEIFLLSPAKATGGHHDARAEAGVVGVQRREPAHASGEMSFGATAQP